MTPDQISELFEILAIVPLFGIVLFLAFAVEAIVEYVFGTIADKVPALTPYKWTLMYIAAVVGVLLAVFYRLDAVSMAGQILTVFAPTTPTVIPVSFPGMIITGILLSRGAQYIHSKIVGVVTKKIGKLLPLQKLVAKVTMVVQ